MMAGPGARKRKSDLDGLPSPGIVDTLRNYQDWSNVLSGVPDEFGSFPVYVDRSNIWIPVSFEWEVNPAGNSDTVWKTGIAYRPMYQIAGTRTIAEIISPSDIIQDRINRTR